MIEFNKPTEWRPWEPGLLGKLQLKDYEAPEIREYEGELQMRVIDTRDPVRQAKFAAALKDTHAKYGALIQRLVNNGD
jgi:hypothetical protein